MNYNAFTCVNRDDWYLYWEATKKIAAQYSSKNSKPVPLPGQAVCKGSQLRALGVELPRWGARVNT